MRYLRLSICIILITITFSCGEDFLTEYPKGVPSENLFYNERGVELLLIGAYSLIDGTGAGILGYSYAWEGAVSNWLWGSVASDDAYLGGTFGGGNLYTIELYILVSNNTTCSNRWITNYDGIARCNDVLRVLAKTKDISESKRAHIKAQALFLRAWFHFELKRVFNRIPFVDENVTLEGKVSNRTDCWPEIEADLEFAVENLPPGQEDVGRPTSWAAKAVLARVHLFQQEYNQAKVLLDDILDNGPFELVKNYHDNYRIATNNNEESIFEIQYSVNDGTPDSFNGGYGDAITFPHKIGDENEYLCCGFHVPSQNLVNAFKTDENDLPLLHTFNDEDITNDDGLSSGEPFTPYPGTVDPRLDLTIGRRGIPYLDWGIHPGADWIREPVYNGPYLNKKNMFYKEERWIYSTTDGWALGVNANNYRAYKLSHIILWRAECAVEDNDLELARQLVNHIRRRARDSEVVRFEDRTPAANYLINEYPSFPDADYARDAVRFELRLEFAMEGHRFFDLVRWGIAARVLNEYLRVEKEKRYHLSWRDVAFIQNKSEYAPIPQSAIEQAGANENGEPLLIQNPGY